MHRGDRIPHFRFGSLADMTGRFCDVCFTPESGHYWHCVLKLGPSAPPYARSKVGSHMFNPTLIVIKAFIRELRTMYERTYTTMEPDYPGVISFAAQLALENIATSDAAYHDVNHTIMVTLVGQENSARPTY